MFIKIKIIPSYIILLTFIWGYFLNNDVFSQQISKIDLETAKKIAVNAAKSDRDISYDPNYVSESKLKNQKFSEYHFLYVWGPLGHKQHTAYAVGANGSAYKLPEQFNKMVENTDFKLDNSHEAQNILEIFLQFQIVWPGTDTQRILNDIFDIPGIKNQKDIIKKFQSVIKPITITDTKNGWLFDFFTWRSVSGVIYNWEVIITKTGRVKTEQMDILDSNTGDYIRME